jgi:hypothetical protein
MTIMCIPLIELLCQTAMRWIPTLEYLLLGTLGVYGHVLSCQTVNIIAYQDSGVSKALWHPTTKQRWSVLTRIHTRCQHQSIDA